MVKRIIIYFIILLMCSLLVKAEGEGPVITDAWFPVPDKNNDKLYLINKIINCYDGCSTNNYLKEYSLSGLAENETTENTTAVTGGGGVSGGGGATTSQSQQSAITTTEELNVAISLCTQENGTPVNIKGSLYCKKGDKYTPLENLLKEAKMNLNIGQMIMPANPTVGWAIIVIVGLLIYYYFKDAREIRIEKKVGRLS
jgi:hypothetical protein